MSTCKLPFFLNVLGLVRQLDNQSTWQLTGGYFTKKAPLKVGCWQFDNFCLLIKNEY